MAIIICPVILISWILVAFAITSANGQMRNRDLSSKIRETTSSYDALNVPLNHRCLVHYHVALPARDDSIDISMNNVKLFVGSVMAHPLSAEGIQAFYVFSVAGGTRNKLASLLPSSAENVALVYSNASSTDIEAHSVFVNAMGHKVVPKFGTLVFLGTDARGPFEKRKNGEWLGIFTDIIESQSKAESKIGIVGCRLSCEVAVHVQAHAFAMPGAAAVEVFNAFSSFKVSTKKQYEKQVLVSLTAEILKLGYTVGSIDLQRRRGDPIFNGVCLSDQGNGYAFKMNPTSWCSNKPQDVPFMKWGGTPMRVKGYYCEDSVLSLRNVTLQISKSEPALKLVLPETIYGGTLLPLRKEWDQELWLGYQVEERKRLLSSVGTRKPKSDQATHTEDEEDGGRGGGGGGGVDEQQQDAALQALVEQEKAIMKQIATKDGSLPKVCLLVRSASIHGEVASRRSRVVRMDLKLLIDSLKRQSNPNWEAYFFLTDNQPFEDELEDILGEADDPRFSYLHVDPSFRPKYDPADAGYTATDEALRQIVGKPQCRWLSVTNGDNAYGSSVINSVLTMKPQSTTGQIPHMYMTPIDSRNFALGEYKLKRAGRGGYQGWKDHCRDFEAKFQATMYGYTLRPHPWVGLVDIAAVFFDRDRFKAANTYFSSFSNTQVNTCAGCHDGYFVDRMVHSNGWTYYQAEIEGLKSIIFHGPSPLHCVASGNVWFDHPDKVECLSHKTVGQLYPSNLYDWSHYGHAKGQKICLRLSEEGFKKKDEAVIH